MAKNQSKDMTVGNPFQIILFFAIPVLIGNVFGSKFKDKATILGGIILIGIGVKILIEHLEIFG